MNIPSFSIRRPVFIVSIVILLLVVGMITFSRLGIELFPTISTGVVTVTTTYSGATPEEIERLISKPLEDQINTIAGLKSVSSRNIEGTSIITAEFYQESDIDKAETMVREKVSLTRNSLPSDLENDPTVEKYDPADSSIIKIAVVADLGPTELYDLVHENIKPMLEKIGGVGKVNMSGDTKREVQIELDRNKLVAYDVSATSVANSLSIAGENVSVGKFDRGIKSVVFRTIGEFTNVNQIQNSVVSFSGDVANPLILKSLGTSRDGAKDPKTLAYLYYPDTSPGKSGKNDRIESYLQRACIMLDIFRQSGANAVSVAAAVRNEMEKVNNIIRGWKGTPRIVYVYDSAKDITANIKDVQESLILGILLAILVVYCFLGNIRSTLITSVAIPVSLVGAFILMYMAGFTMNVMTLMALSLCIGILVDDAIVVQENIYRKMEDGTPPVKAAELGTLEVMLAVIATSLTIISVFTPIGFVKGATGTIFRQFGLTIVFAVIISLLISLTVSPLLNAYFMKSDKKNNNFIVNGFEGFQKWLDRIYSRVIDFSLKRPKLIILLTAVFFLASLAAFSMIKMTFFNVSDSTSMSISIDLPAESSLEGTRLVTMQMADEIKKIPELDYMAIQVGTDNNECNQSTISIFLRPKNENKRSSKAIKDEIRRIMAGYPAANAALSDYDSMGGGRSFTLDIKGDNLDQLIAYSEELQEKMRGVSDLMDLTSSYQIGKPEFQIRLDENRMKMLGVSTLTAGMELRYNVEGTVVGKLHDNGLEYDVRMRLKPEQRDIQRTFNEMKVPNISGKMIPLSTIAFCTNVTGPSEIKRYDRSRLIQLSANISPGGAIGPAMQKVMKIIGENPPAQGIICSFSGEGERFTDMINNIVLALVLSIIAVYLVLSSLYGSFITPFTILLALPAAISGAIFTFLIFGKNMDINSLIGIITLLGIAAKNSILLVDFALTGVRSGMKRKDAIIRAGKLRLRPIVMTTMAIFLGTLPMALGTGDASRFRGGLGLAIVGGILISTIITLVVVPAVFEYIDRLREKVEGKFKLEQ
jgi:HAE1 family hydrophobic/amphiphilic exporter-1